MDHQIQYIWTDLHQELRKFITSKVTQEAVADDILQDVFIKIQLNLHTLTDAYKLTSWVYQITRNTIIDHLRKQQPTISLDTLEIKEDASEEPLYAGLTNCLHQKINALPDKYKQAILLTSFEDFSQLDLASELNISYSGAKTRVQRAREILKNGILDCPNTETDEQNNITGFHTTT